MVIEKVKLENFRCFEHLEVPFHSKLNVLVGANGSGKTALLLALRRCLGTFIGQFSDIDTAEKQSMMHIAPEDVRFSHGQFAAKTSFACTVRAEGKVYQWSRTKEGRNGKTDSKGTKDVDKWVEKLEAQLHNPTKQYDLELPLVAYFSTDRVSGERKFVKTDKLFSSRMRGYFNALGKLTNTEYLKEWFKNRQLEKYQSKKSVALDLMQQVIKQIPGVVAIEYIVQPSDASLESDLYLAFQKDDRVEKIGFDYLSDGQKMLVVILADIAMRCLLLNPQLGKEANETAGVVLIDEVDLHLHPAWQRLVVPTLLNAFPNVQFFVATHSPQVISTTTPESLFILNNYTLHSSEYFTEGRDSNSILSEIFDVPPRPEAFARELGCFYNALERQAVDEAETILNQLTEKWGQLDSDIVRARMFYEDLLNDQ